MLCVSLQRFCRQAKAQPGRFVQRQVPACYRRRILEELCLQRVPFGIGERFYDATGRRRGNQVRMEEAIMVRRHLDVIELTQRCKLAPHCKATEHRTIELQDLDGVFFDECPATIAGALALTGREWNACLPCQKLQLAPIIGPPYGLLEPAKLKWLEEPCCLNGGRKVPCTVDVDHEFVA